MSAAISSARRWSASQPRTISSNSAISRIVCCAAAGSSQNVGALLVAWSCAICLRFAVTSKKPPELLDSAMAGLKSLSLDLEHRNSGSGGEYVLRNYSTVTAAV
jgi:hypothetical protein